jgi:hypothetical protein
MDDMQRDDLDPVDALVRDALAADPAAARRLAREAVTVRSRPIPRVAVLAAFAMLVALAVGVTRYATSEPPIVIRGEGDTIVIETGSGRNKTTEVMHADAPRGGVIIIRQGGDS